MRVTFNLRHTEKKDLRLQGQLTASDLDLENVDELVQLAGPIEYDLTVERLTDSVLVRGTVHFAFDCECVRCLKPVQQTKEETWSWNLPLEGEDRVEVENDCVDLTPYLREDILLAFPQHPLCEIECSGLTSAPQKRSDKKSGASGLGEVSSAWTELNKLKF